MSLSNGEANAFNTIARYFLAIPSHAGAVTDAQAWNALELVREKAYKTLMAGITEDEMRDAFARHVAARTTVQVLADGVFGEQGSAP